MFIEKFKLDDDLNVSFKEDCSSSMCGFDSYEGDTGYFVSGNSYSSGLVLLSDDDLDFDVPTALRELADHIENESDETISDLTELAFSLLNESAPLEKELGRNITSLIAEYETKKYPDKPLDKRQLLVSLMQDHKLTDTDLVCGWEDDGGRLAYEYISDFLFKGKELPEELAREIAKHFSLKEDTFLGN